MNHYETLFILKPTLTDEEIKNQVDTIKSSIEELNGKIEAINAIGTRKLAYPINKNERGVYTVIYHTTPADAISEIERRLRYNENCLRFLTLKYKNKKEISKFFEQVKAYSGNSNKEETVEASEEA